MTPDEQRELVRRGYDEISEAYRDDDGRASTTSEEDVGQYAGWVEELRSLLPPPARVLDLGCGNGLPGTRLLVEGGYQVTGLDFSEVQLSRARRLVPGATFIQADLAEWDAEPASLDAVASFYALIHVPLPDQRALFPRIRRWLKPGGYLLAIVGHEQWSGVEEYFGAEMFWDHADGETYLGWLTKAGLLPIWHRFVAEGESGHRLILAQALA